MPIALILKVVGWNEGFEKIKRCLAIRARRSPSPGMDSVIVWRRSVRFDIVVVFLTWIACMLEAVVYNRTVSCSLTISFVV